MESVAGSVHKVVFRNENGWTIFEVFHETASGRMAQGRMTAVAPNLGVGDRFSAEGEWVVNSWNGRGIEEFKAKRVRPELPVGPEEAKRFLAATFDERRHGIRKDGIERLLAKHGGDVLKTAEREPEILIEASRQPRAFRGAILADWEARVAPFKAVALMQDAELRQTAIDRVMDAHGPSALSVLRRNPYAVSQVRGVGFEGADRIANLVGIAGNDRRRLIAAAREALRGAAGDGHTLMPIDELVRDAAKVAGVEGGEIAAALAETKPADLAFETVGGVPSAALVELRNAERFVAEEIARRLASGRRNRTEAVAAAVERAVAGSKFDAFQRAAVALCATEPVSILTGGPGVGKTSVLKAVAAAAKLLDGRVHLASPTGKASGRMTEVIGMPAVTLHKLLRARKDAARGSTFAVNRLNKLEGPCLVVVDETSMADVRAMAAVMEALPEDGRLLLVGDRHQLPSVGEGRVLADLIESGEVPTAELTKVYRTGENSRIATGAAEIRQGIVPRMSYVPEGGLAFIPCPREAITETVRKLVTGPLRERHGYDPYKDVCVLSPMRKGVAGTHELNAALSRALNPDGQTVVRAPSQPPADEGAERKERGSDEDRGGPIPRVADRVMLLENDDRNDVYNGDVGTLASVERREYNGRKRECMLIDFDTVGEVVYPVSDWKRFATSFAGTIHKSQGSQYKVVIMPMTMAHAAMLERPLIYTGWTRAEELLLLVGEKEAIERAVATQRSARRRTRLAAFLKERVAEAKREPEPAEAAPNWF